MHETATAVAEPEAPLLLFAARLRWQHTLGAFRAGTVRALLVCGTPAVVIAWLVPGTRLPLAVAVLLVALVLGAAAALRARAIADARLLAGDGETSALAVAGDELATWLERRRAGAHGEPMARWLHRDVLSRLPRLPAAAVARAGRRGLGRSARLVPILLLLLLCWFVVEWLSPPWPGVLGGGNQPLPDATTGGGGSGAGGAGGAEPATGGDAAGEAPPPDEPQPTNREHTPPAPTPPPQQPDEQAATPPPGEPPAPFLDLPGQQRFVVPEFVGDGPTRRARMHAAELEAVGASRSEAAPSRGGGDLTAPPPPARASFERAAEQALQARHIPIEEQPIVRRFFDLLRERAR